ncbi:MAG: cbb3-type cytochrome c oxidase subunit 3 [Bdellovibrionaceae bacterium]|nr:cbb3-type cytochrome c oxidase subunit 3 [Pseudobdellovibrionaceae bacterium]
MKKEGLSYFSDTHLTLVGLGIFIVVFTGVILWTWYQSKHNAYSEVERLPLEGDEL